MIKSKILPIIIGLLVFGLVYVSISSLNEAINTAGDKYYFAKKQLMWMGVGIGAILTGYKLNLKLLKTNAKWLYFGAIILLALIFFPGMSNTTLGARRWIDLGPAVFQPSELFKIAAVIYFSLIFSIPQKRSIKHLAAYLGPPFLLIVLEPNLSTAILISLIAISIYYLLGGELTSLLGLSFLMALISAFLIFVSPYRMARLNSLLDPSGNQKTAATYHGKQIILALGSGGLIGKGMGNSDQKYSYIPKLATDSILAIIGEETGFIGVLILIYFYIVLIASCFRIAKKIEDSFESGIVYGMACWLAYQSLINMAAIVSIIPLTGVPLPLVSYGGSSLVTFLFGFGLVMNIERKHSALLYSVSEKKKDNYHRDTHNTSVGIDKTASKRQED